MGLLLPILLGFLASLIGGLYLLGVFRQRQPGEPPLDKGLIPWLGHVLEFRRNTLKFLDRMKQKHGDVFTVQLGGFYITFLQDPLSFGAFIKESREKLDFGKFAKHLVHRVFGYVAEESEHHTLQMSSNKHLKGDGLKVMTQAMMGNLQNLMLHSTGSDEDQSTWIETGLFMYSYNILFRAGYLSLYGNAPPKFEGSEDKAKKKDRDESEALFKEFRKYDQLFPNLAYGVLSPRERSEAQRLMELFWNSLSVQKMKIKDNISGWVWDMQQVQWLLAEESELHSLQMLSNKHLKGDGLKVMTQAMMGNLQNLMLHSTGSDEDQSTWIETGLFMYSYNILFRAGYLSLYGNAPPKFEGSEDKAKKKDRDESEALFKEFRKYDQLFPNLAYGVLSPRERSEAQRLMELFWNSLSVQKMKIKDNISGWVWDMQQVREEKGMDESMINKYMFVLLWASQGNTGPAAFWLLLFLMKNPEAMRAVKEEVDRVLKESGQKVQRGGPLVDLTHEMLLKTPILDSALEETLRLTAAPLLTRAVLQDLTLKMADGREYIIRKGDRMAMFPYSAVHIDPEIHPDPHSFKYDRFLNPDMSKKTDFYKEGKKGNTGPAAFWLLLFLMKNPEAMRAVKEEVDRVLKESGQKVQRGGPLVDLTHEMLLKTPILDSALEETLRLTAAPLLTRAVLQDLTLKMADGREYIIRKGDRMAMFPYSAVHIDPDIHPDPHSFKYDRFLNPDMSKKTDFYKEGKKVKYYNMPWGAGVSMCPGRFFATNEMKQFVFLKLAYFEIELKNPDEKIPEIDFRRLGFGSMQPDRDIDFRYRFRF
ncbi:hypothetical protein F2P81_000476 [Scophthalmus maximus]|uniref:Uncharacterized protein n=1 Tax=Scophthalmus maximus TaxID=52904 RepID=A0A6A4TL87_SCOMX|nr:hypothetical protein F2P81_000476 [Scophthalmus maximus]